MPDANTSPLLSGFVDDKRETGGGRGRKTETKVQKDNREDAERLQVEMREEQKNQKRKRVEGPVTTGPLLQGLKDYQWYLILMEARKKKRERGDVAAVGVPNLESASVEEPVRDTQTIQQEFLLPHE
jgi:hypothetical protein